MRRCPVDHIGDGAPRVTPAREPRLRWINRYACGSPKVRPCHLSRGPQHDRQAASYCEDARDKIRRGVDAPADAVKVTRGPRGRTMILDRGFSPPQIVNSGVGVAKAIARHHALLEQWLVFGGDHVQPASRSRRRGR